MSSSTTKNMELVNILSQAADLAKDTSLDFDIVADHCDKTISKESKSAVTASASANEPKAKKAGKTQAKKRSWKKPKDKPKRPLSAYNLFFQHEREKIVMATAAAEGVDPEETLKEIRAPAADGGKRGRRHRKSHGKIGFAALAKNIAGKWKTLDDAAKSPFEARASKEKERYKAELEKWNDKQKAKKQKNDADALKTALEADIQRSEDMGQKHHEVKLPQSIDTAQFQALDSPHCISFKKYKSYQPTALASESLMDILDTSRRRMGSSVLSAPNFKCDDISEHKYMQPQQQGQQDLSSDKLLDILDRAVNCNNDLEPTSYQSPQYQQGIALHDARESTTNAVCPASFSTSSFASQFGNSHCQEHSTNLPTSTEQYIEAFDTALDEMVRNTMSSLAPSMHPEPNMSEKFTLPEPSLFRPSAVNSSHNSKVTRPQAPLSSFEHFDSDDTMLVDLLSTFN